MVKIEKIILILAALVAGALLAVALFFSLFGLASIQRIASEQTRGSVPPKETVAIPRDSIFTKGFIYTGRTWPPKEDPSDGGEKLQKEFQSNPLCALRQAYCSRIPGYRYADFGCDCFIFQYFKEFEAYTNREEHTTFFYPIFWNPVSAPAPDPFVSDVQVALDREGASCRLSYGVVNLDEAYAPWGSREIMVKGRKLTQRTLHRRVNVSDEARASGYTPFRVIAVPHAPYATSKYGFLLTSGTDQPLVEACASELEQILQNPTIAYPETVLDAASVGTISVRDESSNFGTESEKRLKTFLFFEDARTGKEMQLAVTTFSSIQRMNDTVFLSGTTLYVLHDGRITALEVFGGRVAEVAIPYNDAELIHAFFVRKGSIYYLEGADCSEYLTKCSLNVKRYDMAAKTVEVLAAGVASRDIVGFDATGDTLYLVWAEGDAGCMWGEYEALSLSTKTVKKLGEDSHCIGDEGQEDGASVADAVHAALRGMVHTTHLMVREGKLLLPPENDPAPNGALGIRVEVAP